MEDNATFGINMATITGWFKQSVAVGAAAAGTMACYLLNGIPQGAGPGQRVGNEIYMERLLIGGVNAGSECWLVYDAGTNGALPSVTDANNQIFSIDGANTARAASGDSNTPNLFYRDRFRILATWNGGDFDLADMQSVPLFGLTTVYNGSGSTVASIQTGGLYLVVAVNSTAGTAQMLLTFSDA